VVAVQGVAITDKPSEDLDGADAVAMELDKGTEPEHDALVSEEDRPPRKRPAARDDAETTTVRRVSLSLRTLLAGVVMLALVAGLATTTWLYLGARAETHATAQVAADRQRAEQVALDYAVNAAAMNFQDLNTWKNKLVAGTSPELKDKLTKAANSMEQLLIPLQWTSSAEPLAAKVRSDTDGVYVVDTFVSVLTKTTQAPDSLQSTATYSITIDSHHDWLITDVGGIGAVVGGK
jgi:hypothetical protein